MSSTVELDENFFTCSICNDDYDDPRSLPCLHSFCRNCLSQHICYSAMDSPPSFLCPVCRGLILVPAAGKPMAVWAEFFPGNFWLKDLMSHSSAKTSSGSLAVATCSEHPKEQVSMFCVSCQAVVCNICISAKHSGCSGLVILVQKDTDSKKMKASIERLDKEIAATQGLSEQVVNELSYLTRQRDKARNAIENHAATFILKLDRAKKDLFSKLDSEYHNMKRDLDKQIATDHGRLLHLKSLKASAQELLQKSPDTEDAYKMDAVIDKMNETLLCSGQEERLRFERMRATFSPDYSWHGKDISLGTVTFYNSKLPAGSAGSVSGAETTLTRSKSSVQLRHPKSTEMERPVSTSQIDRMERPVSVPQQQIIDPVQRRISAPQLSHDTRNWPDSQSFSGHTGSIHRSVSSPWMQSQPTTTHWDLISNDLQTSKTSNPSNKVGRPQIQKDSTGSPLNSTPVFFCGDDDTRPNADSSCRLTKEMSDNDITDGTTGTEYENDIHPTSMPGSHTSTEGVLEVASTKVLSTFLSKSDGDEQLPHITSLIVTTTGDVMVADSANKSIKTLKPGRPSFAVSLQYKPYGLAVSSEDRAVISSPESKELIVISIGEEPKIISRINVQRCYSRLMNYRPGITAAVCPDLGCIDLVTLQGRTMKSFRILDEPANDIPFFVDSNQTITVWDPVKYCLMSISKSGTKLYESIPDCLKYKDVTGLACDSTGFIYVIYEGKVAKVSRSGGCVCRIDNVFSCQCMFVTSNGDVCVAETGGECKILSLS